MQPFMKVNPRGVYSIRFPVRDYDLDATLDSGQVFGWRRNAGDWLGVIGNKAVRLRTVPDGIEAKTTVTPGDWVWLKHYLQVEVDLEAVLASFPIDDRHLTEVVAIHRGLRLLRQPPWECLAGFILSSTKQVVQIQQVHRNLCERFGERIPSTDGRTATFAFPTPMRLAQLSELELRSCKMGFRAPYLRAAAIRVARGELNLERLGNLDLAAAREELLRLDGVGEKIANCVLLFACGFASAFPVDVWVRRTLQEVYFGGRTIPQHELSRFIMQHFGPNAGYAQQYLFHHARVASRKVLSAAAGDS